MTPEQLKALLPDHAPEGTAGHQSELKRRDPMRRTNVNAVLKMVRLYLDGQISRIDMELDFLYEIEKRYQKMCSEDREYAELIYDRLLDDGVVKGEDLPDEEFRELIKQQYKDVLDIARGGFW
jgi:GH35 family endo-1,4-beta-xylanase